MASANMLFIPCRSISTTSVDMGKRNFRKFLLYGKRGTRLYKEQLRKMDDYELLKMTDRGVRSTGLEVNKRFQNIPEMIPEIIVPDLTGFQLKPYVSYRVPDVIQGEFRPQDLFYAVYSKKIAEDFKNGKLDKDGNPIEPSEAELLSAEAAKTQPIQLVLINFLRKLGISKSLDLWISECVLWCKIVQI